MAIHTPTFDAWQDALRHDRIGQVQAWLDADARMAGVEFPSGETLLTIAAGQGAIKCLEALLPHSDPHHQDGTGWTPMMHALNRKSRECAAVLLKNGGPATFEGTDDHGRTPLHLATEKGMSEAIQAWLDLVPVERVQNNLQAIDHEGKTPWHEAASRGNLPLLQMLVNRAGSGGLATPDGESWTPLLYAVLQHHREVVEFLAPISPVAHANSDGTTAIGLAEWNGEERLVPLLRKEAHRQEVAALQAVADRTMDPSDDRNDRPRVRL